ncbi:MAG: FtsX-like permease family protein [Candidatus Thermoplasmatota archaeon]|nr:FtsX-like permease family protein [Candidatus Thermoplasmatota archaeon]
MALVPPIVTIITGLAPAVLILLLLMAGISTRKNRASSALGVRMFARNIGEGISRIFPVALLASIIVASLSVGDGLLIMVEENTDANLSGIDLVIDLPSFIDGDLVAESMLGAGGHVTGWKMLIGLDGIGEADTTGTREGIQVMGFLDPEGDPNGTKNIEGFHLEGFKSRTGAFVNRELADSLDLEKGDRFFVTVYSLGKEQQNLLGHSSSSLPRIMVDVEDVIENDGIGRYREDSLGKVEPTVIMQHSYLGERIGKEEMVNKVMVDIDDGDLDEAVEEIRANFYRRLTIQDAGFLLELKDDRMVLTHREFFFHPGDLGLEPDAGSLSYFVDGLSTQNSQVSYSVIAGIKGSDLTFGQALPKNHSFERGKIYVTNWTMERMNLTLGESIGLTYRKVTELGTLVKKERYFTVSGTVPMSWDVAWDGWMPDLPGITAAPSCGDWDPSFDIDMDTLTDDDYEYWNLYRATPKAFISVEDAREMWGIPSGNTTMVILDRGNFSDDDLKNWSDELSVNIGLESVGGSIRTVRKDALDSSRAMLIFPGMFLTFGSIIMIGAMLVLYALFKDLAARRANEWGMLRAMGTSRKHLLLTGMFEALVPIVLGGAFGIPLGYLIGYLLNLGLGSAWSNSVEGVGVPFHIGLQTLVVSLGITLALSLFLAFISVLKEAMGAPIANLRDEDPKVSTAGRSVELRIMAAALLLTVSGLIILYFGSGRAGMSSTGMFVLGSVMISSGAGLLVYVSVAHVSDRSDLFLMVSSNLSRRPGKNPLSIAILSMILTLALSLTFMGSLLEEDVSSSYEEYGGGFTWVVETAIPYRGEIDLPGMGVSVLLSIGEEGGTCSNMNAPYPPRLLGVEEEFDLVSNFGLISHDGRFGSDREVWRGLHGSIDGMVPILVDQNTLQWIYFASLGSKFELNAEDGQELTLLVVGILEPSVLTGTFVMSKDVLREEFPSLARPTYFLVSGGGGSEERNKVADAFSDSFPDIEWVGDLASENLDQELSYLYLFRDFLVFGLVVAMTSAAIFIQARALSLKREVTTLRSVGVTRKRSIQYFLVENLVVFSLATFGSVLGSLVSILMFGPVLGGGIPAISTLSPVMIVVGTFLALSIVSSLISAYRAMGSVSGLAPRI